MNGMLSFIFAVFFQFEFRETFGHTYISSVIAMAAFFALKPDKLSFTFLGHKIPPVFIFC